MMFRNSFKVFCANFNLSYKLLVYKAIVWVLIVVLACAIFIPNLLPVFEDFNELGVTEMIRKTAPKLVNFLSARDEILSDLANIKDLVKAVLIFRSQNLLNSYIGLFFLIVLEYFLSRLGDVAVASVLYGTMQYQSKYSFGAEFVSKIVPALKYALLYMAIFIPIDLVIVAVCLFLLFGIGESFIYFAPMVSMLTFLILYAFRMTLCVGWLPTLISEDIGVVQSFKKGFEIVKGKYSKIFSSCLVFIILAVMLFFNVSLFTFGSMTPLLLVCYAVAFACFRFVTYFSAMEMQYYANPQTVILPDKRHGAQGNFNYDLYD